MAATRRVRLRVGFTMGFQQSTNVKPKSAWLPVIFAHSLGGLEIVLFHIARQSVALQSDGSGAGILYTP